MIDLNRLTARREDLGYTQRTLARAMDDIVTDAAIGLWENGAEPSGSNLLAYAKVLGLTPQEVLDIQKEIRSAKRTRAAHSAGGDR